MLKCALGPHEGAGGLARPLQDVGEPAALRDFSPVFVSCRALKWRGNWIRNWCTSQRKKRFFVMCITPRV